MAVIDSFADFIQTHPLYGKAYAELSALNRKAALAAAVVHAVYPVELGLVAEPLLGYLRQRYGGDLVPRYASRLLVLEELQVRLTPHLELTPLVTRASGWTATVTTSPC